MVIPERLRQFAIAHIDSPEAAEILTIIRREALRAWDPQAVGSVVSLAPKVVEQRLQGLVSAGLLSSEDTKSGRVYRYNPSTPELARIVNEFVHWYWSYPSAVIAMAFSDRPKLAYGAAKTFGSRKA